MGTDAESETRNPEHRTEAYHRLIRGSCHLLTLAATLVAMNLLERITIKPGRRSGKPCLRETRITVYDVLGYLAAGMSEAELLRDFPDLNHEDILACFAFAAERDRKTFISHAA